MPIAADTATSKIAADAISIMSAMAQVVREAGATLFSRAVRLHAPPRNAPCVEAPSPAGLSRARQCATPGRRSDPVGAPAHCDGANLTNRVPRSNTTSWYLATGTPKPTCDAARKHEAQQRSTATRCLEGWYQESTRATYIMAFAPITALEPESPYTPRQ